MITGVLLDVSFIEDAEFLLGYHQNNKNLKTTTYCILFKVLLKTMQRWKILASNFHIHAAVLASSSSPVPIASPDDLEWFGTLWV